MRQIAGWCVLFSVVALMNGCTDGDQPDSQLLEPAGQLSPTANAPAGVDPDLTSLDHMSPSQQNAGSSSSGGVEGNVGGR
jgi:hypothetical protein